MPFCVPIDGIVFGRRNSAVTPARWPFNGFFPVLRGKIRNQGLEKPEKFPHRGPFATDPDLEVR